MRAGRCGMSVLTNASAWRRPDGDSGLKASSPLQSERLPALAWRRRRTSTLRRYVDRYGSVVSVQGRQPLDQAAIVFICEHIERLAELEPAKVVNLVLRRGCIDLRSHQPVPHRLGLAVTVGVRDGRQLHPHLA